MNLQQSDQVVWQTILGVLCFAVIGCSKPAAYNPELSAKLLEESNAKLDSALRKLESLKEKGDDVVESARSIQKFPWEGWRIEPGTKNQVTSPIGKKYTYTFVRPFTSFGEWDELGNFMVKLARESPNKPGHDLSFTGREFTSEEASKNKDVFVRIRQPLEEFTKELEGVADSTREVQTLVQRSLDLLPRAQKERGKK